MLSSIDTSVNPMNVNMKLEFNDQKILDAAIKLEATFLSEMLKSAGIDASLKTFGGGAGEDHFSSFLRDAQALEVARSGGIGLADILYRSMKENSYE